MLLSSVLVGVGGFIGAVFRYLTFTYTKQLIPWLDFPIATLIVNAIGSFFLGFLTFYGYARFPEISNQIKLMFATGMLGAFTTFSTFSVDIVTLILKKEFALASVYILSSLAICVLLSVLGMIIASKLNE